MALGRQRGRVRTRVGGQFETGRNLSSFSGNENVEQGLLLVGTIDPDILGERSPAADSQFPRLTAERLPPYRPN